MPLKIRKALFLDRDGVINEDRSYVHKINDFVLLPRVIEAVRIARTEGFLVIVVTNQSGVARNYYKISDVLTVHAYMQDLFARAGAPLDAVYYCPHHPEGIVPPYSFECECRKPKPGMILRAAKEFQINLSDSIIVGDQISDVQAGLAAGVGRRYLVNQHALAERRFDRKFMEYQSLYACVTENAVF